MTPEPMRRIPPGATIGNFSELPANVQRKAVKLMHFAYANRNMALGEVRQCGRIEVIKTADGFEYNAPTSRSDSLKLAKECGGSSSDIEAFRKHYGRYPARADFLIGLTPMRPV